jgi:hypothetical protein
VSDLEYLARPFNPVTQLRPPGPTTKPEPKDADSIALTFGSPGNDIFTLSAQNKGQVENNEQQEESRKYDKVRVKNPADHEQYVDVEVITEYQARNKIDDKRTKIFFRPPESSADVEVLSRNHVRTTSPES